MSQGGCMPEKVSLSPSVQQDHPEVIPTELIPLPSGGKVYPPESPLSTAHAIEIRSMTARDEDILTSRVLIRSGKMMSTLLRSCIVNRAIDVEQMLAGDRNAELIG